VWIKRSNFNLLGFVFIRRWEKSINPIILNTNHRQNPIASTQNFPFAADAKNAMSMKGDINDSRRIAVTKTMFFKFAKK
jgi:hypothetical protein